MGGDSFSPPPVRARVAPMPTSPKSKLIAALLVVVAMLALPAAAGATLTYTKGFNKPHVYIAEDSGKGARQIGPGSNSHISPNGEWVVYERLTGSGSELRLYSVAAAKSERVLGSWVEPFTFAWSPDSSTFAALTGPLNGPKTLLLIDAESGRRTKVATGYFDGVSFSPEGTEVVYAAAKVEAFPAKSDIFKASVEGGTPVALTRTHDAIDPVWGPTGQIVFARQLNGKSRKYHEPENQLFVMNEEGQRIRQLSHTKVHTLSFGLVPTQWSANGRRLLAEYGGQDQSYAVALNTVTGAEKALTDNPETGFAGAALSADGTTVLGTAGLGFGPSPQVKVVTMPFSGGPSKVLVPGGYNPSWTR
jgi:Tol biopolymer transport system component